MAVIFNEDGLKDITVPCVAQSFINHNAVLLKIYVIGTRQFIAQRPSLKNFNSTDHKTIFFDSHDVSKPTSSHFLNKIQHRNFLTTGQAKSKAQLLGNAGCGTWLATRDRHPLHLGRHRLGCAVGQLQLVLSEKEIKDDIKVKLDAVDLETSPLEPNIERLKEMGVMLRKVLNMDLFGVDIIIDSETHKHAIIDVNIFPGYDEVDDFFQVLLDHMLQVFRERDTQSQQTGDVKKLLTTDSTRIEHLNNDTTKNVLQNTGTPSCKRFKSDLGQFKHSSHVSRESNMHSSELECKNGIQQFSNSFLVNNSKDHPS